MTEGDSIPPNDHVGVHCQPLRLDDDVVQPSLFHPRLSSDEYLSCAWLEHTKCVTRNDQIKEVCRQMVECPDSRTVRRSHKLALLNVGESKTHIFENVESDLDFLHHPEEGYESHSGIHGIELNMDEIAMELAEICWAEPVILP